MCFCRRSRFSVALLALVSLPDHALAQAAGIRLGETELVPTVSLVYLQTDNAFLTQSNPVDASGYSLRPELEWSADRRLLELTAFYRGDYSFFDEESLDFTDHAIGLTGDAEFSSRQRAEASLAVRLGHENLGTNRSLGAGDTLSEPVRFRDVTGNVQFNYGAIDAKGNLSAGLRLRSFQYANQSQLTDGSDFTRLQPFAGFSYRLSGDTRLTTEVRYSTVDYDDNTRDRSDVSLLAGLAFAATGKLGGALSAGVSRSSFDGTARSDATNLISEIDLYYRPVDYSEFVFGVDRRIYDEGVFEGADDAEDVVRTDASLRWQFDWSERVYHRYRLSASILERECPGTSLDYLTNEIDIYYRARRWLELSVGGAVSTRSHNACEGEDETLNYDQSVIRAALNVSL